MTPRERILLTLTHQQPDRTPTTGWFHDEVKGRLLKHYNTSDWDEVLLALGIEGWAYLPPVLDFSDYEARTTERPGPEEGKRAVWLDERTYEDAWGVRHRIGEGGWYQEWVDGPLSSAETPDDVADYDMPGVDRIREPENYATRVTELKAEGQFVTGGIPNPFLQAWTLRGMENTLADYLIHRDILEAMYDRIYDLYGEMCRRMARAGVDMISITGDIAMQDRLIMSPALWREVDKPRLARLLDECRKLNPDMYWFIHSDGNVMEVMDDLVEIGFDIINPIQPECMDPVEVKRRWGDRITLHGCVSLQRTLPFGTPDDVRKEVEDLIRSCGYNGGLVVFPSNVLQPDTSVENILACFHAARDFDVRSLDPSGPAL